MAKQNQTVLEFFISKFEGQTVADFLSNVEAHVEENYDLIEEWIDDGVDELSIKCQEDYIRDIQSTHKLYKGIMTYDEVKAYVKYCDKQGEDCESIFIYEKVCKSNFDNVKHALYESCLSVSDAYEEEEIAEEERMRDAFNEITTIKALKQWLQDFDIEGNYGVKIWKGHIIDSI